MVIKSHTFMTADERLRQEIRRRQKSHMTPLTNNEAVEYLDLEPVAGWCTLDEEEKEYLYIQCEKTWYHDCRVVPNRELKTQNTMRLKQKREHKADKETSNTAKRVQYAAYENYPVYHTDKELEVVLQEQYPVVQDIPARPKYSTRLKTHIVRQQLNVRKWVYHGTTMTIGCLLSKLNDSDPTKLQKLRATLTRCMEIESIKPLLKTPPLIRAEYAVGPNTTKYRLTLDAERNKKTRAMEKAFADSNPGCEFVGHKCLYDYGKGKPLNPTAIVGQKVRPKLNHFVDVAT